MSKHNHHHKICLRLISRREFLAGAAATATGLLAGCNPATSTPTVPDSTPVVGITPTDTPIPTATSTSRPTATLSPTTPSTIMPTATVTTTPTPLPTVTPEPTTTPTNTPDPTATSSLKTQVAVGQAENYERALIREQVRTMLDGLGGLGDVISSGDRVGIKVNLTGGAVWGNPSVSPTESYMTHPEVVRALVELLRDAGAGEIFIVEAVAQWAMFPAYQEIAQTFGAILVNLSVPDPYPDFVTVPVGENWFIYQDFVFNRVLTEVDAFVSVAKMKCHWSCGVTHSIKNLVGLVPVEFYRLNPADTNRSALHGEGAEFKARLPRVIMDFYQARPIDLALIDGIKTVESGEGPWIESMSPVAPGVLVAGKDAVAADASATAAMMFDPTADYPSTPFLRADNHLNLAYELGLGTNRLDEIEVVGAAIDTIQYPFISA